jgi:hypothetical protein
MRCLMEDAGDVAFVKHTTPIEFSKDGSTPQPWSSINQGDLRLLCPTGGCKPVNQYLSCNVARVPAHAGGCPPLLTPAVASLGPWGCLPFLPCLCSVGLGARTRPRPTHLHATPRVRAVLVRANYPDTALLKRALVAAGALPAFRSLVFNGATNPSSFLFKPSTK